MLRLPLVLVLPLLGCGCAQASPRLVPGFAGFSQASLGLGLASAGLWLCTGFSRSLSCLSLAVFFSAGFPGLVFPFAGL